MKERNIQYRNLILCSNKKIGKKIYFHSNANKSYRIVPMQVGVEYCQANIIYFCAPSLVTDKCRSFMIENNPIVYSFDYSNLADFFRMENMKLYMYTINNEKIMVDTRNPSDRARNILKHMTLMIFNCTAKIAEEILNLIRKNQILYKDIILCGEKNVGEYVDIEINDVNKKYKIIGLDEALYVKNIDIIMFCTSGVIINKFGPGIFENNKDMYIIDHSRFIYLENEMKDCDKRGKEDKNKKKPQKIVDITDDGQAGEIKEDEESDDSDVEMEKNFTGYAVFLTDFDVTTQLEKNYPKASERELSKIKSVMWREMNIEQKKYYHEIADKKRLRRPRPKS